MSQTLKTGDVVQLKSGGPKMTVSSKLEDGDFSCTWFDSDGKQWFSSFSPDMLVRVDVGRG